MRHVEEATPMRSLREQSEREGARLQAHIEQKSETILRERGVRSEADESVKGPSFGRKEIKQKSSEEVAKIIEVCIEEAEARAEMAANPVPYEEPEQSVSVAVDDVGVKRQKAARRKGEERRGGGIRAGGERRGCGRREKARAYDGGARRD